MIRNATIEELPALLEVYESARAFMRAHGNPTQWSGGYPNRALLKEDIALNRLYAVTDDAGEIHGAFMLLEEPDPTYAYIEGEGWRSDTPYGTLHRVASDGRRKGVFEEAVAFARTRHDHLRVDTFRDNIPMQNAIQKQGFVYRGVIYLENGDPRMAYDWLKVR